MGHARAFWATGGHPLVNPEVKELLESSRIEWCRDWDAVLIGFVLGILTTLAVQTVW